MNSALRSNNPSIDGRTRFKQTVQQSSPCRCSGTFSTDHRRLIFARCALKTGAIARTAGGFSSLLYLFHLVKSIYLAFEMAGLGKIRFSYLQYFSSFFRFQHDELCEHASDFFADFANTNLILLTRSNKHKRNDSNNYIKGSKVQRYKDFFSKISQR
jgi:hypothetical protein